MEFDNTFTVEAPIDEVWDAMLDVERVAPCVPGASVIEQTGDNAYKVAIKVKLGPVSMTYRGDVEVVESDAGARRAVMSAKAKESRGQGTADATVEMRLSQENGATHGAIHTHVAISGKAAAMGQGIIGDVSARLIDTFAGNLAAMLAAREGLAAAEEAAPAGAGAPREAATAGEADAPRDAATAGEADAPRDAATAGEADAPGEAATAGEADAPRDAATAGEADAPGDAATAGEAATAGGAGAGAPAEAAPAEAAAQVGAVAAEPEGLPVLSIAGGVIAQRLRDPKVLAGIAAFLVLLLWRRRR
jgi:uncharacterized protein